MGRSGSYKLHVVDGADVGTGLEWQGSILRVVGGCSTKIEGGCLYLNDATLEGEIAELRWEAERQTYLICNRSLTQPLLINGLPSTQALLQGGALINIGQSVLQVEAPARAGATAAKPRPPKPPASPLPIHGLGDSLGGQIPDWAAPTVGHSWSEAARGAKWSQTRPNGAPLPESPFEMEEAWEREVPLEPTREELPPVERVETPREEILSPIVESAPVEELAPDEEGGQRALGRIRVLRGDNQGLSLVVYGTFTIGRSPQNDFVLTDPQVSRQHCSIQFLEDGVYLVNHSLSSTTKIGPQPVAERGLLGPRSEIILANKVLLYWEGF